MNKITLEVQNTGGNCQAYVAILPNGWELVITDHSDPSLPDVSSSQIDVGIYRDKLWTEENQVIFETVNLDRPGRFRDQAHIKYICEAIAFKVAGRFIQFTVPCGLCGTQTPMTFTERCDRCWELETRIRHQPALARRILKSIKED